MRYARLNIFLDRDDQSEGRSAGPIRVRRRDGVQMVYSKCGRDEMANSGDFGHTTAVLGCGAQPPFEHPVDHWPDI